MVSGEGRVDGANSLTGKGLEFSGYVTRQRHVPVLVAAIPRLIFRCRWRPAAACLHLRAKRQPDQSQDPCTAPLFWSETNETVLAYNHAG